MQVPTQVQEAGMVAVHRQISTSLYQFLKEELVDFVDDVDNGRIKPKQGQPDFTTMVDCYNHKLSPRRI